MHLRSRTVLAVSLILSLAACGGEEPVVDPEIGLEGPAALLLHPGSSRSVTLSLQRNETATGEVSFEVSDLPKGVTADFSPPTLPVDGQVTTLTLHAEREADRGAFMVIVRAHGAGLSAERALALEVRGVTVNGQVNSKVPGLPPEPVTVRIGTLSTETDADDAFVLIDVVPPYDFELQSSNSYVRYVGLASVNPVSPPTGPCRQGRTGWPLRQSRGRCRPSPARMNASRCAPLAVWRCSAPPARP